MCLFEDFLAMVKKNSACLNYLVYSREPANTRKKQRLLLKKEKLIKHQVSFSQKPKEATKTSNK